MSKRQRFRYDVFVSYSGRDQRFVRGWLVPQLRAKKLRVCLDADDFHPGAPSVREIERAVVESRKTILVLTPAYLKSEWTELESWLAQTSDPGARQRRLIPILLADCKLPPRIEALTHIDFRREEDWRRWLTRLLRALRSRSAAVRDGDGLAAGEPAVPEASGAEAEGKSASRQVRAGKGGVAVGGDAGDIHITNVIDRRPRPKRDKAELRALAVYRTWLFSELRHLPLRGLDPGASDATGRGGALELERIYVRLDTTQTKQEQEQKKEGWAPRNPGEAKSLSALEAVAGSRRAVLLGQPGSGKSTFLRHLALCLTGAAVEPKAGWLKAIPAWPARESDAVPLFVALRDFAAWLPASLAEAAAEHLCDFIASELKPHKLTAAAAPLERALEEGTALVLLDGLDEIGDKAKRTLVRDALHGFAARYRDARIVVSCRTFSYQDAAWQLDAFPSFELAPWSQERIDCYVDAWYGEQARLKVIKAAQTADHAARLKEAVRRPDLARLAPNPLLLTVMALVHTHHGALPDARAQLYDEAVKILLWRWEQLRAGRDETPALRALLRQAERDPLDLECRLCELAFNAQGRVGREDDGERVADIAETDLIKALALLHPEHSLDWAREVARTLKLRAGLLVEPKPEVYTFPHRTFQEYLAGAHLAAQPDCAARAAALAAEGPYWRQVILLAAGHLVYVAKQRDKALALAAELCPEAKPQELADWRRAWLGGEVLVEVGPGRLEDSSFGKDLARRGRERLVGCLRESPLGPVERAEAGNALARLGDPRFRKDAWWLPAEPLLGFVEVPAGPFWMGSDRTKDKDAYSDETPQHQVILPRYYVARYPVTVAQWAAFVEDSGRPPGEGRSLQGPAHHPVRFVTWLEAVQYSAWLTAKLREWAGTPEPLRALLREGDGSGKRWQVALPSEAEWEKAARGGDRRIYPWEGGFDPNRANTFETGIGSTSAVGAFPGGRSPHGMEELSGNVWEWTRSLWAEYPYEPLQADREAMDGEGRQGRVLRGGAFRHDAPYVRCAFRFRNLPDSRNSGVGFRVVASPFFSGP